MKIVVMCLLAAWVFAACTTNSPEQSSSTDAQNPQPSATPLTPTPLPPSVEAILEDGAYNLLITEKNFGVDEIIVSEGDPLVLNIRSQLREPMNVVIEELNVNSPPINFGEVAQVVVPTTTPGEYEMYSGQANHRGEGFTALIVIEEK